MNGKVLKCGAHERDKEWGGNAWVNIIYFFCEILNEIDDSHMNEANWDLVFNLQTYTSLRYVVFKGKNEYLKKKKKTHN